LWELGDGFEERLNFAGWYDEEDRNRVKVMEVMKVKGNELDWFKII
jgi:hypothetical protein